MQRRSRLYGISCNHCRIKTGKGSAAVSAPISTTTLAHFRFSTFPGAGSLRRSLENGVFPRRSLPRVGKSCLRVGHSMRRVPRASRRVVRSSRCGWQEVVGMSESAMKSSAFRGVFPALLTVFYPRKNLHTLHLNK